MNIKEHIEAGHYPVDEKGRALVPMRGGETATIIATDRPGADPIVGWWARHCGVQVDAWAVDGVWLSSTEDMNLLPPPPRKVKLTAYCVPNWYVGVHGQHGIWWTREHALEGCRGLPIIELTGEYEEPWS